MMFERTVSNEKGMASIKNMLHLFSSSFVYKFNVYQAYGSRVRQELFVRFPHVFERRKFLSFSLCILHDIPYLF